MSHTEGEEVKDRGPSEPTTKSVSSQVPLMDPGSPAQMLEQFSSTPYDDVWRCLKNNIQPQVYFML